ncbi:MAG: lipoyl(octanoyl) transferase LipB [Planctomycetes bacterium]|nr:lipoyl(octanoyl) transferase LipB [Planctomycetota bacterium]
MDDVQVHDLGRIGYAEALERQRSLHERLVAGRDHGAPMQLLLLEHDPPVITVSRRPGAERHVLAGDRALADLGVQRVETDRGGDVTWHGPGQLVAYPILDLQRLDLRIHGYMRLLEQVVLDTLQRFGLEGRRDETATGVWVGDQGPDRKIAAMGVRVSRWATLHGLALNVDPDLRMFDLIVPCGLTGRPVTSLRRELGHAAPDLARVKRELAEVLVGLVARRLVETGR